MKGRRDVAQKTSVKPNALSSECQICERSFTARGGLLAKHGYRRPGTGFLHGECRGTRREAFPAFDALEEYEKQIDVLTAEAALRAAAIAGIAPVFQQVTTEYVYDAHRRIVYQGRRAQTVPVILTYAPGVSDARRYEGALIRERMMRSGRLRQLENELSRVTARIVLAKSKSKSTSTSTKTKKAAR